MRTALPVFALAASAFAQQSQDLNATLSATDDLSQLADLLGGFPDLVQTLSAARNVTILAPSNDAISALLDSDIGEQVQADPGLLRAVLTYHVLNGTYRAADIPENATFVPTLLNNQSYTNVTGGQVVQVIRDGDNVTFFSGLNLNSSVTQADVNFTGGVVHIIDSVLTLPQNDSSTALAAGLTALAGALTQADLVSAVDGLRDVTIFAPSNTAFENIGSALGDLSDDDLASILQYHVVNGTVGYSSVLEDGLNLTTLGGQNVTVTIEDGSVFVNGAQVITPDVLVSNGVVHIIDNVLNPSNSTATPSASATAGAPAFSGASSAAISALTSGITATPRQTVAPGPAASSSSASEAASSSSSEAAAPAITNFIAPAALFGAGAVMMAL